MRQAKYWIGKIIGLSLGAVSGGFIGLVLGLVIGAIVDKLHKDGGYLWLEHQAPKDISDMQANDFVVSAILLAAAVVKSDGRVEELELSYIRSFLIDQFGAEQIDQYWTILTTSIDKEYDLKKTCRKIRINTTFETRLQLIYFLFGIAQADYKLDDKEIATIKVISIHLGINSTEFNSIKAMFYSNVDAWYNILGLSPACTDAALKAAYRNLCNKYHPDKLQNMGVGVQQSAQAKFLKVKSAYENIKKERGIV